MSQKEYHRWRGETFKGPRPSATWLRCTCGRGGMMGEDHTQGCPYYFKEYSKEQVEEFFKKARGE